MRSKKQKLYAHIKLNSELDVRGLCDKFKSLHAQDVKTVSFVEEKIQEEKVKKEKNKVELEVVKVEKK
jgi:hypothetical protein